MRQLEIYWSDLNLKAKKRLKEIYHDNIELSPIAIIEIEEPEINNLDEDDDITIDIKQFNKTDYD